MTTTGYRTAVMSLVMLAALTPTVSAQMRVPVASHRVGLEVVEVAAVAFSDPSPVELVPSIASAEGFRTLRYTSINSAAATREILVQWASGDSAPRGTTLSIAAASVPRECGQATTEVFVGDAPKRLITGIPSCTTGISSQGAVLRYKLDVENALQPESNPKTEVSLIFTICDR